MEDEKNLPPVEGEAIQPEATPTTEAPADPAAQSVPDMNNDGVINELDFQIFEDLVRQNPEGFIGGIQENPGDFIAALRMAVDGHTKKMLQAQKQELISDILLSLEMQNQITKLREKIMDEVPELFDGADADEIFRMLDPYVSAAHAEMEPNVGLQEVYIAAAGKLKDKVKSLAKADKKKEKDSQPAVIDIVPAAETTAKPSNIKSALFG